MMDSVKFPYGIENLYDKDQRARWIVWVELTKTLRCINVSLNQVIIFIQENKS